MRRAPLDIRAVMAVDQAKLGGYAIGLPKPQGAVDCVHIGATTEADGRAEAFGKAVTLAGGWQHLLVVFEDHADFYFGRGNSSVAALLSLGGSKGAWVEHLKLAKHPEKLRLKVTPKVWGRAVLGLANNAASHRRKQEAQRYAAACLGRPYGEDESDAYCILCYAARQMLPELLAGAPAQTASRATRARAERPALPAPDFTICCRHCGQLRSNGDPACCDTLGVA